MKLNLGSGLNRLEGYTNVDKYGDPDVRFDLETFPWPWEESSVEEVVLNHVLEHLGESTEVYFGIIKELYRICRPGALIKIAVPHPRHDHFLDDPTHVRAITPDGLGLFSKANNQRWKEQNAANSPLGFYLDVDFEIVKCTFTLEEPWLSKFNAGEISKEEMNRAMKQYNNVIRQTALELKVIK